MPWVPKSQALRMRREQRRWSTSELARKAGVSRRTIERLQSVRPPPTIQFATISALAGALRCEVEEVADFLPERVDVWESSELLAPYPALERVPVDSSRALEELTPTIHSRCISDPIVFKDKRFLVAALVEWKDDVSAAEAAMLRAYRGDCGRFVLAQSDSATSPAVYTRSAHHYQYLSNRLLDRFPIRIIVRLFIPEAQTNSPLGVGEIGTRSAFALVVEEIIVKELRDVPGRCPYCNS